MKFFLKSKVFFLLFLFAPFHLKASDSQKNPVAVISADYDGCFDILFSAIGRYLPAAGVKDSDKKEISDILKNKIKLIEDNHEKIHFFNGSARQSDIDDIKNRKRLQTRNRFLLSADEGYLKKDYKKMTEENSWEYDPLVFSSPKVVFLTMQIKKTYKEYKDLDHIDFYFFDDRKDILEGVKKYFSLATNQRWFKKITLHLIQYDWFSYLEDPERPRTELEDFATFSK